MDCLLPLRVLLTLKAAAGTRPFLRPLS